VLIYQAFIDDISFKLKRKIKINSEMEIAFFSFYLLKSDPV